jgi:hypothetical protein
MKTKFMLIVALLVLLLTACQDSGNGTPTPTDGGTSSGAVAIEIDDKINDEVVKVIQDYIKATHTKDEDLIRSTVLKDIGFDERAFALWHDSKSYDLKKLTYGSGDEKNEVVTVTFTTDEILSFALTKTDGGWKILDVD